MSIPFSVIEGKAKTKEETTFDYQKEMLDSLDNINSRCWNRGTGYKSPNFPLFTEATSGFDNGLYLFAAVPNAGKTSVATNLAYDLVSRKENDMFAMFFSLDDTLDEVIPRMVSMTQRILIDVAKKPKKYEDMPDLLKKRDKGFKELKDISKNFVAFDTSSVTCIEQIEEKIKEYKMALFEAGRPKAKFIIIIDSFHDLDSRDKKFSSDNDKGDYMSKWTKDLSKNYDCIVMCTAHLRKLNGYRRPTYDDVKSAGTIAYEANVIVLCHNDVGLKGEKADVYYTKDGNQEKQPVIELHFGKNKLDSFKGRIFAEFIPEYSFVGECSQDACKQYNMQVFQA